MPPSKMTWYKTKANKIMKSISYLKQKDLAVLINVSPQVFSYRMKHIYPQELMDFVRLLDEAGYQIVRKEED